MKVYNDFKKGCLRFDEHIGVKQVKSFLEEGQEGGREGAQGIPDIWELEKRKEQCFQRAVLCMRLCLCH